MATVTLWTDVRTASGDTLEEAGAQTTGTWANVSKPSGATASSDAPVTYNGSINYTGEPDGTYVYSYTVNSSVIQASVTVETTPDRVNTTCANYFYISSGSQPPYTYVVEDDSREVCGEYKISTVSDTPLPSTWAYGSYSGDLWYLFKTDAKDTSYQIQFTVDGSIYSTEGIYSPAIEVLTHDVVENCSNNVQQAHQASPNGSQIVTTSISIPAVTTKTVVFRVSSLSGNEGRFDITIEGICPS